jgi:hypothetical protein
MPNLTYFSESICACRGRIFLTGVGQTATIKIPSKRLVCKALLGELDPFGLNLGFECAKKLPTLKREMIFQEKGDLLYIMLHCHKFSHAGHYGTGTE